MPSVGNGFCGWERVHTILCVLAIDMASAHLCIFKALAIVDKFI